MPSFFPLFYPFFISSFHLLISLWESITYVGEGFRGFRRQKCPY